MVFDFNIITPNNTTRTEALATKIKISRGVIVGWRANFPPGSKTLLHLSIFYGGHQIIPYNPGNSLIGHNTTAGGKEFIPVLQQPLEIIFKTWNEDDTYQHQVYGEIDIVPIWSLSPFSERFKELLDEERRESLIEGNLV